MNKFKSWMALLGLLGFLGFVPKQDGSANYFFFIFFGFFSFYWWGKLGKEHMDERLITNMKITKSIISGFLTILVFFMLFLLDRNIKSNTVLLIGSLGYAFCMVFTSVYTYYLCKVKV